MALELKWRNHPTVIAKIIPRDLAGKHFERVDWSFLDMARQDLSGSVFVNCGFAETDLRGCRVTSLTQFLDCDLSTALGGPELIERINRLREPRQDVDWGHAMGHGGSRPPTLWEMEQAEKTRTK